LLSRPPTGAFGVLNPTYTSKVTFGFEQPLLRNYGIALNQVLPAFGGSNLFTQLHGGRATGEGILVARLRFDHGRRALERSSNYPACWAYRPASTLTAWPPAPPRRWRPICPTGRPPCRTP